MYKIGDFSKLSKVTVRALRFYEKVGLLKPARIDSSNNYRYYNSSQLIDISRIVLLRQLGFSIEEIKQWSLHKISLDEMLATRKSEIEKSIEGHQYQLVKIKYLMEDKNMQNEIFEKLVPACFVYYKEGTIKNYDEALSFIRASADECRKLNPTIKCVTPDYCFVNYLDKEYKEKNIKLRYAQAIIKTDKPFVSNDSIKFMDLPETKCACIYHKGDYNEICHSYSKVFKYIEDNDLEIQDFPRECYIDGIWNKQDPNDWLTEIQVPIK